VCRGDGTRHIRKEFPILVKVRSVMDLTIITM